MGTLFSTLDIARSGMQTAQVQLDTAGHNIANVNKPGFSRQRVELVSRVPITTPFGQIGRGVGIAGVEQVRDAFLDALYRRQAAGLGDAELRAQYFNRIEDVFLEPGENGLSGRLNAFFDALSEFSGNVEEVPVRQSVLTEAESLTQLLNETATRISTLRTNANEEVVNFVPEINSLAERIAALNHSIRQLEITGKTANDLRDDRGVLLDGLGRLVNIFTRERDDGTIDVLVTGEVLVNGDKFRPIEALQDPRLIRSGTISFVCNLSITPSSLSWKTVSCLAPWPCATTCSSKSMTKLTPLPRESSARLTVYTARETVSPIYPALSPVATA